MAGLFTILDVGVRGMSTQQSALNVTSHNVANANTEGYTRQRALIQATKPLGGMDMLSVDGAGQMGTGSEVSLIQRVRDSFTDYQIRNYTTTQGQYTASERYLNQVQGVFNEPSDTGISNLLSKFFNDWQKLSNSAAEQSSRQTVATDTATLTDQLNNNYRQLQNIQTQINTSIKADVSEVNTILDQVHDLNKQIMLVKAGDNEPNDLMDKRDNLLDKLSSKFGINIDSKNYYGEDITSVTSASGTNPNNATLVSSDSSISERRFSYVNSIDKTATTNVYTITYYKNGDTSKAANMVKINVDLGTNLPVNTNTPGNPTTADVVANRLQQLNNNRVLWADNTGVAINADGKALVDNSAAATPYNFGDLTMLQPISGEFVGYSSAKVDTDKYIDKLNNLAKGLAFAVNAIHSGYTSATGTIEDPANPGTFITDPNNPKMLSTDPATGVPVASKDWLQFFVNSDDVTKESEITAGNISINKSIANNVMLIKTKTHDNQFANTSDNNIDAKGDGARAKMIGDLQNNLINFANIGTGTNQVQSRSDLFVSGKGGNVLLGLNFQNSSQGMTTSNCFKSIISDIGTQEQTALRTITNVQTTLDVFNQNKEATSGVSLDEEMANMVQFQHSYQANAKIISTVDDLLDVVINGLKK